MHFENRCGQELTIGRIRTKLLLIAESTTGDKPRPAVYDAK
jgi:hypothetical protein